MPSFGIALLLVCLGALLQSAAAKAGSGSSQADRASSRKRGTCESTECEHLHFLENTNCVNKCVSRKCYDDVYKGKELEDGEINTGMERCVRAQSEHIHYIQRVCVSGLCPYLLSPFPLSLHLSPLAA